MGGIRRNIYFTTDKVIEEIEQQKNVSKYVDAAVLFYIENHDLIKDYIKTMTCVSNLISKK